MQPHDQHQQLLDRWGVTKNWADGQQMLALAIFDSTEGLEVRCYSQEYEMAARILAGLKRQGWSMSRDDAANVMRTDMLYRRSDLDAAIAQEQQRGGNTGLLHAARRAARAMGEWLKKLDHDGQSTGI